MIRCSGTSEGARGRHQDNYQYGIVTFAKHPWNKEGVVIFCGGMKGPATAASLRRLAEPKAFDHHPLGGVFRIAHPGGDHQIEQWNQLMPEWVTSAYTIDKYLAAIEGKPGWESMPDLVMSNFSGVVPIVDPQGARGCEILNWWTRCEELAKRRSTSHQRASA